MMFRLMAAASLIAGTLSLPLHASSLGFGANSQVQLSGMMDVRQLLTTTGNNDDARYVPSNAEKDGTVRIRTVTNLGAFTCSGSIIGSSTVLTAAHCVNIPGATVQQVQIYRGGGSAASGFGATGLGPYTGRAPDHLASNIITNPHYFDPVYGAGAGNPVVGIGDLAVLWLDSAVPAGTKILELYNGDPLGKTAEHISYGTRGTGAAGGNLGVDLTALFEGRKGKNVYDGTYEGIFKDLANGMPAPPPELLELVMKSQLVYDFDPLEAVTDLFWGGPLDGISFWRALADFGYNVFVCPNGLNVPGFGTCGNGTNFIAPQINPSFFSPSLGLDEALIDGGDSGGAALIDGMVAGIHSFGTTLSASFCPRMVNKPDILCGNNSSFGEVGGDTNVAIYRDWIVGNIPEPAPLGLLAAGLMWLAVSRRRAV